MMFEHKAWLRLTVIATLLTSIFPIASQAKEKAAPAKEATARTDKPRWVRIVRNARKVPQALQTATVRYRGKNHAGEPVMVDLVAAIHIGDRSYYEALNKQFKQYDALLYELVAKPGTRLRRGAKPSSGHPVGAAQNGLKNLLQLEHQLTWVDYTKKNFVHADMSPRQFARTMADRGESFSQMLFRLMGSAMAAESQQQARGESHELNLLAALFASDRPLQLKRAMAGQLEQMESILSGFGGPDGSTIITERNKVALDVLAKRLTAGERRLGIFYGAGHMEDMDQRLRTRFKLLPDKTTWTTAWDLSGSSKN